MAKEMFVFSTLDGTKCGKAGKHAEMKNASEQANHLLGPIEAARPCAEGFGTSCAQGLQFQRICYKIG